MKNQNRAAKCLLIVFSILCTVMITFLIYTASYYHADMAAIEAAAGPADGIYIGYENYGRTRALVFDPGNADTGIVFYPGAKVQYEAYAPLMRKCAENGLFCAIVKMPFNLAFFGIDSIEPILNAHPELNRVYIAGHSLGGAMAAQYAGNNSERVDGLILEAAFSAKDLTDTDIPVLIIRASEDGVMTDEKYEKYSANINDPTEVMIEDGCHAGFGSYGPQKGDGDPAITSDEQMEQCADVITKWIAAQQDSAAAE